MFINAEDIKLKDFQGMCRTCLKKNNLNSIKNNFIIEVLHNITDINYRIDEELPQNICDACVQKIHEIRAFAFQCIETDLTLKKCRNNENLKTNETIENIKIEPENESNETNIQYYEIKDLKFDENVIEIDAMTSCKGENLEKWFEKSNDINYSYMTFTSTNDENVSDAESDNSTNLNIIENEEMVVVCETKDDFKCEICAKTYKTRRAIQRHRDLFPGSHFSCDCCQQIYTKLSKLRMHKKKHKFGLFCEICNKMYTKGRSLREHRKKVHEKESNRNK